jgi:zinc transport system ATP-binding protein
VTLPANALEVEHLSVEMGEVEVVRDLSFSVPKGTSLAVIGPNGSGKTVLFRALIGAVPHTGTVRWAEGTRLGYVPQRLDLDRTLPVTGEDLLMARARLSSATRGDIERVLTRVGLAPAILEKAIGTFSGGQFQRLLLAFALLGDPTVLLLDEPTAGIDEPGQERVTESVRRLQEEGVTVLMISHELNVVVRFATNVLCLSREHTYYGVPRQVLTPELLARVYGEPVALYVHDDSPG